MTTDIEKRIERLCFIYDPEGRPAHEVLPSKQMEADVQFLLWVLFHFSDNPEGAEMFEVAV